MVQNKAPKIDTATLRPAEWSANPRLEWCPPGHGDLYATLRHLPRAVARALLQAARPQEEGSSMTERPGAPPQIDSLRWLRAERRFRVVWRGFPRARATLEPAENLMPSGCAPRPFAYFPSLTTWCGQAGLHSCDAARADGGWSARLARRRGGRNTKGRRKRLTRRKGKRK